MSELVSVVLFCRQRWTLFLTPSIFSWFLFNTLLYILVISMTWSCSMWLYHDGKRWNQSIERVHHLRTDDQYVPRHRCRNLNKNKILVEGIYQNKRCAPKQCYTSNILPISSIAPFCLQCYIGKQNVGYHKEGRTETG